jgi:hypothetical protein
LAWNAPYVDVTLRVELPFWLMVDNSTISVEVGGHAFSVDVYGETFELQVGSISDAKQTSVYQGPFRRNEDLGELLQKLLRKRPKPMAQWRKCKTVLEIASRCNEDVWEKRAGEGGRRPPSVGFYLVELCRAHIPVVNALIRGYRLGTYDRFAFEVAPWDVPFWYVSREGQSILTSLVSYREWDRVPLVFPLTEERPRLYRLIDPVSFQKSIDTAPTPGEFELLDAINFMERGNYSDAVRRIATAIEAIVEARCSEVIERAQGTTAAATFLKKTRTNFPARLRKYEELSNRTLSNSLRGQLEVTRQLRHRIVHRGHRILPSERDQIQKCIDMGRWTFNWLENDPERQKVREGRIAFRSLGREMPYGMFRAKIVADGVVVESGLNPNVAS